MTTTNDHAAGLPLEAWRLGSPRTCGIHGTDTTDGRCATCDEQRAMPRFTTPTAEQTHAGQFVLLIAEHRRTRQLIGIRHHVTSLHDAIGAACQWRDLFPTEHYRWDTRYHLRRLTAAPILRAVHHTYPDDRAARIELADGRQMTVRLHDGWISSGDGPHIREGWPSRHYGPATYGHVDEMVPAELLDQIRAEVHR